MTIGPFPPELWRMILQMDPPGDICVVRKKYVNLVRQACTLHDAGIISAIQRLPDYERSQWARMRRYYKIHPDIRDLALSAQFQERWLTSFDNPILSSEVPVISVPHRLSRTQVRFDDFGRQRYDHNFCGGGAKDYMVIDICDSGPWHSRHLPSVEHFQHDIGRFLEYIKGRSLFHSLNRIDLIVAVAAWQRQELRADINEIVDCIREQWETEQVDEGSSSVQNHTSEVDDGTPAVEDRSIRVFWDG